MNHKPTADQRELLGWLSETQEQNTKQIREARGDRQSYESPLRDRLFRLRDRGFVACRVVSPDEKPDYVRARYWLRTVAGTAARAGGAE